ncbi:MAG: zinc ribbon domain-containing protein [Defluviitaleaceae bacterium]|nr:zinc ribbon domain-containing protein [Defluviitaleaceae bacterium]
MFCKKCKTPIEKGDNFCTNCAAPFIAEPPVLCKQCNKELRAYAKFCSACAAPVFIKAKSVYKSLLIKVLLTTLAICTAASVVSIIIGGAPMWRFLTRAWLTYFHIASFALFTFIAIHVHERRNFDYLLYANLMLIIGALIYSTVDTWFLNITWGGNRELYNLLWDITWSLWVARAGFAHISLMLLIKNKVTKVQYSLIATVILLAITYTLVVLLILADISNEVFERLMIALSILSAFGTVATPLMSKLTKTTS